MQDPADRRAMGAVNRMKENAMYRPGVHDDLAPLSYRALWGLVCGLVSIIPFVPFGGLVLGPLAVFLGVKGRQDVTAGSRDKAMAVMAIVCGVFGVVSYVLITLLMWRNAGR
jgi:hypothetical protein